MPILLLLLIAAAATLPGGVGALSSHQTGGDSTPPPARGDGALPGSEDPASIAPGEPLTEAEYTRQLLDVTTPLSTLLAKVDANDPESVQAALTAFSDATATVEGMTAPIPRRDDHAMLVASMRGITSDLELILAEPDNDVAVRVLGEETSRYGEALGALGIVP